MTYPPPRPHGPVEEVFSDVFVVTGSFRFGPGLAIARNMTIVRDKGELTIINSVRLDDQGERDLEKLGAVKHLIRLGAFHGSDDPYFVNRFHPTYWAPPKQRERGAVKADKILADGGELPIDARAFVFACGSQEEGALVLKGGTLVTCDAVQNWTTTRGCSLLGGFMMKRMGFFEPAKIGPIWMKSLAHDGGPALKPDFDRLMQLDFQNLLSGHGTPMKGDAKEKLAAQVAKAFKA